MHCKKSKPRKTAVGVGTRSSLFRMRTAMERWARLLLMEAAIWQQRLPPAERRTNFPDVLVIRPSLGRALLLITIRVLSRAPAMASFSFVLLSHTKSQP